MARKEDKAAFEAAVLKLIERYGPEFDRAALVAEYRAKGIGQSTLYRWLEDVVKSGKAGVHLAKVVKKAAAKRAKESPDPAAAAAREVVEILPPVPKVEDMVSAPSGGVVSMVDRLAKCIATAEELMQHARNEEGKPRNVKLLLAGSEHLRRSVQTCVQLQEAMLQVVQVERFHEAVYQALREEKPELVERVLLKLRQINAQYGM